MAPLRSGRQLCDRAAAALVRSSPAWAGLGLVLVAKLGEFVVGRFGLGVGVSFSGGLGGIGGGGSALPRAPAWAAAAGCGGGAGRAAAARPAGAAAAAARLRFGLRAAASAAVGAGWRRRRRSRAAAASARGLPVVGLAVSTPFMIWLNWASVMVSTGRDFLRVIEFARTKRRRPGRQQAEWIAAEARARFRIGWSFTLAAPSFFLTRSPGRLS